VTGDLFDELGYNPRIDIQTAFEKFHRDNPDILDRLAGLALELLERGHKRCGIKMLYEVLRWQTMIKTTDEEAIYKLCNNYHSRYARRIMVEWPELRGFFALRRLHRR
jgi:hypothetical protein